MGHADVTLMCNLSPLLPQMALKLLVVFSADPLMAQQIGEKVVAGN